jgi:fucose permease
VGVAGADGSEDSELTRDWRDWGRWLATIAGASFALGALLTLVDALNLTAPAPSIPPDAALPDRILAILQNQSQRFPVVLIASLVAIVAFAALAALGPVLRRAFAAAHDPRGSALVGLLALGGAVGVIGQLIFVGGQAVASDATYCECAFRDPQLIARGGVLDLVSSINAWMTWGSIAFFAAGLFVAASHPEAGRVAPRGWIVLTRTLASLMAIVAVVGAGFPPLAQSLRWDLDPSLVTGVPSLVVLLVLVPWWSFWLRGWLGSVPPSGVEPESG